MGLWDLSVEQLKRSLIFDNENPYTHYNLGMVFAAMHNFREAIISYDNTLALDPDFVDAHNNRGNTLKDLGRYEESLLSYEKALELKPDYVLVYCNRGNVLIELDRLDAALEDFTKALSLNPHYVDAYSNRVNVFLKLERLNDALDDSETAIALNPSHAAANNNRGNALTELNRLDEALASYDKALALKPDYAEAYNNRGNTLRELKRLEESRASYDRAIEFKCDFAEAYFNKSLSLLLGGDFVNGFNFYEWRLKSKNLKNENGERLFKQPLWLGKESLANKRILLYSEQGLGDTLQFCRYAKLVAELGAKVILEVPRPLVNLLQNLVGVDRLVPRGSTLPDFDYHCPLMSLPLAFKTTIETIPAQIPYIHSSTEKQDKWREHIGNVGFKIAICWQGSTKGKVDVGRSFPVSLFEDIAKINGVRLISLQKNEGAEQLKNLPDGMKIESLPDDFDSGENAFLDSAAVMKCVDLVITSDTALTHLAGALGVNAWLPLKHVPDWRWMLDRCDSPWYLNHSLFRQMTRDDWTSVFKEMETELANLLSTK
jgi:hypothetical protein